MANTMADEKKRLRSIIAECRAALPSSFADSHSAAIHHALTTSELWHRSSAVALYSAKDREVDTRLISDVAFASARKVLFPRYDGVQSALELVAVRSLAQLTSGSFGILEPPAGVPATPLGDLGDALVVVPGIAFTRAGARLGRGGGHYDRLLAALPRGAITIGLAYSFQLLDRIPQGRFDRALDFIATESGVFRAGRTPQRPRDIAERGGTPGWST